MPKPRASRVYESAAIVCSCEGGATTPIENVHYVHSMGSLFFCPSCQTSKCSLCCATHLESRFCANCGTNSTDTGTGSVCDKNCFVCPVCTSDLLIHGSNTQDKNGVKGKTFAFKCGFCDYQYVTPVVTTPRPLHRILNGERKRQLPHQQLFDTFKVSIVAEDSEPETTYTQQKQQDEIRKKLSQLNITHDPSLSKNKKQRVPIDLDQDMNDVNKRKTSNEQLSNYFGDIANHSLYSRSTNNTLYPLGAPLTLRWSYSCLACHTILAKPSPKDPNKFLTKWNAIDFLPAIDCSYSHTYLSCGGAPNEFMLHFRNALANKIHLNISSPPVVPDCYVSTSDVKVQVAFPISKFSVGPNKDAKDLIKSIPTAFLSKNTVQARVEYQERLARKLEQGLEVLDNILDAQYNWCLIPINVTCDSKASLSLTGSKKVHIKLPLYVTVNSKLPESIELLSLLKETLNVGYWCLVDLGEYTLQNQ